MSNSQLLNCYLHKKKDMATSFRSGKNERVCDDVSDRDNDITIIQKEYTFWYRNRKNANALYLAPEQ